MGCFAPTLPAPEDAGEHVSPSGAGPATRHRRIWCSIIIKLLMRRGSSGQ
jgi:hypothetical protein